MTIQADVPVTATNVSSMFTEVAEMWAQNLQKVAEQVTVPSFAPITIQDTTASIERWFDLTDRVAKVNRDYMLNLASAFTAFGGAVREHVEGLTEVLQDHTQAVSDDAKDMADKAAQTERDLARAAKNAERQKVRQARQPARERYEGLTKAELSEELGHRGLPKTGNVDELVERLVDADLA